MGAPMTGWPAKPVIYEINTAVWLGDLSRAAGRRVTLADVPAAAWDDVTPAGVDAVWLMGVWERSPAGLRWPTRTRRCRPRSGTRCPTYGATTSSDRRTAYAATSSTTRSAAPGPGRGAGRAGRPRRPAAAGLCAQPCRARPSLGDDPPGAVRQWRRGRHRGRAGGLGAGRRAHPGPRPRPVLPAVARCRAAQRVLARAARGDRQTLADIAGQCDGIRCDMAMLMTNQVFAKTWGGRTGPEPDEEFWPTVIAGLRSQHPETVLVAEAYWDMEWTLQQQGFDFCYDKRLYDRIVGRDAAGVRDHLRADLGYQSRLLRFLENHDEPRIAGLLPGDAERAAAVAIATLPGATLWHEGQFEGRRVRPPVFLSRRPGEPPDPGWPAGTGGCWPPWPATGCGRATGSCSRRPAGPTTSPAATSSPGPGPLTARPTARPVRGGGQPLRRARRWTGRARLDRPARPELEAHRPARDRVYERSGDELADQGLFVALPPWGCHLLAMRDPRPDQDC